MLELGAYNANLDWLHQFGPVTCHWGLKTLMFIYGCKSIIVQGVLMTPQDTLLKLSLKQLSKWITGDEVWTLVIVDSLQNTTLSPTTPLAPDI